ncbi:hypothetical protein H4R21_005022 [Coemansia helicoidea]|uniref:Uncharacterized protein n=1 Tax=Coemansia helicoidea TaxID=1286919 RepID=A0ACC1KVD5_9FUNG|nr:hypothetical protein H4R21_005022 [Coemansia helicoidea]
MAGAESIRPLYWRFVVLGVATLAAWNVYTILAGYFRWALRTTPFKDSFESVFSIVSNSINLAALACALFTQTEASLNGRIWGGLVATAASFGAMAVVAAAGLGGWAALVVALAALGVAAAAAAYIQCSLFAIAAALPPSCTEGYMGGQAIAGTAASVVQLVIVYSSSGGAGAAPRTLAETGSGNPRLHAAAFFGASGLFLALCAGVWAQLHRHLAQRSSDRDAHVDLADAGQTSAEADADCSSQPPPPPPPPPLVVPEGAAQRAAKWLGSVLGPQVAGPVCATCAEVAPAAVIVGVTMAQTLAVFPPLTEAIVGSPQSALKISHLTAWHFLVYNVGDYAGRLSTQWLAYPSLRVLSWISHARWLLIPILLLFPTAGTAPQRALVVHSDLLFLAMVLVLGWTNGWAATCALILGPRRATSKELAGSVLGLALCVGLFAGALASYPLLLVAGIS